MEYSGRGSLVLFLSPYWSACHALGLFSLYLSKHPLEFTILNVNFLPNNILHTTLHLRVYFLQIPSDITHEIGANITPILQIS